MSRNFRDWLLVKLELMKLEIDRQWTFVALVALKEPFV